MSKVTFEEDELAVVALFQENTRKDTIDILKDTLEVSGISQTGCLYHPRQLWKDDHGGMSEWI